MNFTVVSTDRKGRMTMLGRLWTTIFALYTAVALPLLAWALASAAS